MSEVTITREQLVINGKEELFLCGEIHYFRMKKQYWAKALDALLAQYENTFGIPEVPGAYMTERMLTYAFNAVVTDSSAMSPRQALYTNIYAIDQELTRKREEYHLSTAEEAASQ